ncbi:MAG TPA: peptidylprolyl isomerase [Candidatus Polarisedimenticolia bacterium]|nr:peptidylprolyl isomerase [Candidatus Polarisedimenticolia bacterium]
MRRKPLRLAPATAAAFALLTLLPAAAGPWAAQAREAAPEQAAGGGSGPLQATLEILKPFTYEGDPLLVRLAVFNTTDKPYDNAAGVDLLGGLQVVGSTGGSLALKHKGGHDARQQPAVIPGGGFFGVIQDITSVVPDVSKAGVYTLSWKKGDLSAPAVTVKVIPKFDPAAPYVAVMETDLGSLEFDLLTKEAPKHVQNFYDLSHQGFYDNTLIHQVIKGIELRGGDPSGSGRGWPGYVLEQEISPGLKHRRGTLSAIVSGPRQDNGSQFVVTLGPMDRYDGQLSIFGQLKGGEETLRAIENLPTSGQMEAPYYKPLTPVLVRSVTIRKAAGTGM